MTRNELRLKYVVMEMMRVWEGMDHVSVMSSTLSNQAMTGERRMKPMHVLCEKRQFIVCEVGIR
jgi:hypothetical protein